MVVVCNGNKIVVMKISKQTVDDIVFNKQLALLKGIPIMPAKQISSLLKLVEKQVKYSLT